MKEFELIRLNIQTKLPEKHQGEQLKEKENSLNLEAKALHAMRLQNLAITIDKVVMFLHRSKSQEASNQKQKGRRKDKKPEELQQCGLFTLRKVEESSKHELNTVQPAKDTLFTLIDDREDEEMLWSANSDSIRSVVSGLVVSGKAKAKSEQDLKVLTELAQFLESKADQLPQRLSERLEKAAGLSKREVAKVLSPEDSKKATIRKALIFAAFEMKKLKVKEFHSAIADLLVLQSFTWFVFKSKSFSPFEQSIDIRECDLTQFDKYLLNSKLRIEDESKIVHTQEKYSLLTQEILRQLLVGPARLLDEANHREARRLAVCRMLLSARAAEVP